MPRKRDKARLSLRRWFPRSSVSVNYTVSNDASRSRLSSSAFLGTGQFSRRNSSVPGLRSCPNETDQDHEIYPVDPFSQFTITSGGEVAIIPRIAYPIVVRDAPPGVPDGLSLDNDGNGPHHHLTGAPQVLTRFGGVTPSTKLSDTLPIITSITNGSLWGDAFSTLTPGQQQIFHGQDIVTVVDDILQSVKRQKDICEQRRSKFTWRGKLYTSSVVADRLISWVETFIQVGDTIVQYDPVHAALPWAGVRFVLQAAVNYSHASGEILIGVERVTNFLVRAQVYEVLYLNGDPKIQIQTALETQLRGIYAEILMFLVKAKSQLERVGPGKVISSIFDTGELSSLLAAIEGNASDISRTATVADTSLQHSWSLNLEGIFRDGKAAIEKMRDLLQGLTVSIDHIGGTVEAIYVAMEAEKRQRILEWLSFIEYKSHHVEIQKGIVEDTGKWLVMRSEYKEWHQSPESCIFWLHGIAGAGKTNLTSTVIERHISQSAGPAVPMAYFYCNRAEESRRNPRIILSTLLKQLALFGPQLPKVIASSFDRRSHEGSKRALDIREIRQIITTIASIHHQVTLIIDALDEMDRDGRVELFDALKLILQDNQSVVKIFLTSRYHKDIKEELKNAKRFAIRARDNKEDIDRFITREVEYNISKKRLLGGEVSDELRQRIQSTLIEKSQGMFQWVDLQLKFLCEFELQSDLENNLGRLPDTLHETYSMLYTRIESYRGSAPALIKKALMWIMYAQIPLAPGDWKQALDWGDSNTLDINRLLHLCNYLVIEDTESNVIRFAHLSVREFLDTKFSEGEAHQMIAEACVTACHRGLRADWTANDARMIRETFLGYALECWPTHVKASNQKSPAGWEALTAFLTSPQAYLLWIEYLRIAYYIPQNQKYFRYVNSSPANPVFGVAYLGIDIEVMGHWPAEASALRNTLGMSLLHVAAVNDHEQIARKLLAEESAVPIEGLRFMLEAVIINGNRKIAEILYRYFQEKGHLAGEPTFIAIAQKANLYSCQLLYELQTLDITECVLLASVSNTNHAKEMTKYLLGRGGSAFVTDSVVAAAVGNIPSRLELTDLLLETGLEVHITPSILQAINLVRPGFEGMSAKVLGLFLSNAQASNIDPECLNVAAFYGMSDLLHDLLKKQIPLPITPEGRLALWINSTEGGDARTMKTIQNHDEQLAPSDEHGWTIDHVTRSCTRVHRRQIAPSGDCSSILKPSTWADRQTTSLRVCGLELTYLGCGNRVIARADHPVMPGVGSYFEIELLECPIDGAMLFGTCPKYDIGLFCSIISGRFSHQVGVVSGYWVLAEPDWIIIICSQDGDTWARTTLPSTRHIYYPAILFEANEPIHLRANFAGPFKHTPPIAEIMRDHRRYVTSASSSVDSLDSESE